MYTHTHEREMPLDVVKSQKTFSASSVNYKDLKLVRKICYQTIQHLARL